MKRDMELVRDILLFVEASDQSPSSADIRISGHGDDQVSEHLRLLMEAGLLAGISAPSFENPNEWLDIRLTWEGHDFLDAARDNKIWKQATTTIASKVGTVAFDILKALLSEMAKQALGLA